MYCINFRGQRTSIGIPVCSLGKMPSTAYCNSVPDYETFQKVSDEVTDFCEYGNEISCLINDVNLVAS
jgi:hypothetical protein